MSKGCAVEDFAITLIGGGNIGSHLVPLLARSEGIRRLTIVDHDSYEARNLRAQDIHPDDVGWPKAVILAARARRLNPTLRVVSIESRAEQIPPGRLRADLIVACLDSRRARQAVNQVAFRLNVPWMDTAVGTDELLARVAVYMPGARAACFECGWDEADYRNLEVAHECGAGAVGATGGIASLGALTAAVAAIEIRKLLRGDEDTLAGREMLVDCVGRAQQVTRLPWNPRCRFDHAVLSPVKLECDAHRMTLRHLVGEASGDGGARLRVEGATFVRKLTCVCGRERETITLAGRWGIGELACGSCGRQMREFGFANETELSLTDPNGQCWETPVARLGIRVGDILRVARDDREEIFELVSGGTHD